MDTTKYQTLKELDSSSVTEAEINTFYLKKDWVILNIRSRRVIEPDGSFTDYLVYTLGHESPHARAGEA